MRLFDKIYPWKMSLLTLKILEKTLIPVTKSQWEPWFWFWDISVIFIMLRVIYLFKMPHMFTMPPYHPAGCSRHICSQCPRIILQAVQGLPRVSAALHKVPWVVAGQVGDHWSPAGARHCVHAWHVWAGGVSGGYGHTGVSTTQHHRETLPQGHQTNTICCKN